MRTQHSQTFKKRKKRPYDSPDLKYLLSTPSQKKFINPNLKVYLKGMEGLWWVVVLADSLSQEGPYQLSHT